MQFDKCVVAPVLLYGSEVWGYENTRNIEIFHRNSLRTILKTFNFTPKCMLYGGTVSMDMTTKIRKGMVNLWARLKFNPTEKFSSLMCQLLCKLHECNQNNYVLNGLGLCKTHWMLLDSLVYGILNLMACTHLKRTSLNDVMTFSSRIGKKTWNKIVNVLLKSFSSISRD